MSHLVKSRLSIEDSHCIETYQLGLPLGVYTLNPGWSRFFYCIGVFLIIASIASLSVVIATYNGPFDLGFFNVLLVCLSTPLFGGMVLRIWVPQTRRQHVVICEQGLLQVDRVIGKHRIEVMHWKDILTAWDSMFGRAYTIFCHDNKPITLTQAYQDFDEMVALIQQHSGME